MRRDRGRAWNGARVEPPAQWRPSAQRVPLVVALFVWVLLAPLAGVGAYHVAARVMEMMP